MESNNLLANHQWQPFAHYGLTHPFWTIHTHTILATSLVTLFIIFLSLLSYYFLKNKESTAKFTILKFVQSIQELVAQSLPNPPRIHLAFIGSFFIFILFCNCIFLIPGIEEPTKDINTTLALGLISFFYVQWNVIAYKGLGAYLYDFIQPFFLMLPLNIMGRCTSILSLSFRLFGNIFGGYVIGTLYGQLIASSILLQIGGLLLGTNLFITFFSIFEGIIQAFVFSMLTLTYLSMEIVADEEA